MLGAPPLSPPLNRLSDLLLAGTVMNCSFQPHEAHIPFPLQFMIDYNLYGMNYLHLAAVKFRIVGEGDHYMLWCYGVHTCI